MKLRSAIIAFFASATALTASADGLSTAVDVGQYVPVVSPYLIKALGAESKSGWGRMAISNATSVVIMAGTVEGLKLIVNSERPDHSNNKSFPSGHTAWANLGASIIDYEFSERSPLFPICAYGFADAIAIHRIASHRHHPVDIFAGSAIGFAAGRLGYGIYDLISKKSWPHLNEFDDSFGKFSFSMSNQVLFPLNGIKLQGYDDFDSPEAQMSMNADYRLNPRFSIGAGLGLRLQTASLGDDVEIGRKILPSLAGKYHINSSRFFRFGIGAECGAAIDVSERNANVSCRKVSPRFGAEISAEIRSSENSTIGIFVAYDLTSSHYDIADEISPVSISKSVSSIGVGFRTSWSF